MVLVLILTFIFFGSSFAQTYKIAEPDAYQEFVEEKDKTVEKFKKYRKKIKKEVLEIKGKELKPTDKSYYYEIDPTYEVKEDIPKVDRFGNIIGILYPKGFRFNPLDFLKEPPEPMIIFNPCIDKEKNYVKKLINLNKDEGFLLVTSGCPLKKIKDEYGMQIYILTKEVQDKFKIKNTISIIRADMNKKVMRVDVVKVK